MQGVLGYLQGPRDAAVTLETAPVLEVPTVRVFSLKNLLPPSANMIMLPSLTGPCISDAARLACRRCRGLEVRPPVSCWMSTLSQPYAGLCSLRVPHLKVAARGSTSCTPDCTCDALPVLRIITSVSQSGCHAWP